MTSQPPLLDGTGLPAQAGASLPGPQFMPRPGWGGRLHRWCTHNAYHTVFRMVIVVALVLVARSLFVHRTTSPSPTPTPDVVSLRPISIPALAGDGMTNLAARALDVYLALQTPSVALDGAQHLFAVDALARTVCWCPLEVNQEVSFVPANIKPIVDRALGLSPAQRAAWSRLLR